tara:strand:+ start:1509 stop:2282 length:774 start_codon:yes stop_codon:yes gene_type:complete
MNPITVDDLDFMQQVNAYRYQQHQKRHPSVFYRHRTNHDTYNQKRFASGLKRLLTHPDSANIGELCGILSAMRLTDQLRLLNMRPTLINDRHDLFILIKYTPAGNDRVLLAFSQIEKLFSSNEDDIARHTLTISKLLPPTKQAPFCQFADRVLQKRIEERASRTDQTNTYRQDVAIVATVLISAIGISNHLLGISPTLKIIALASLAGSAIQYLSNNVKQNSPTPLLAWHIHARPNNRLTHSQQVDNKEQSVPSTLN